MKDTWKVIAAFASGALAMYYLDARMGHRRRVLVRDKMVAAGHDTAEFLERKGKRAADRVKGVWATGRLDRHSSTEPHSDAQLCERVRSRLGHLVMQPKAIQVEVEEGQVRLSGHVLNSELDRLLSEVAEMAGVRQVHSALATHQHVSDINELLSRRHSAAPQHAEAQPH